LANLILVDALYLAMHFPRAFSFLHQQIADPSGGPAMAGRFALLTGPGHRGHNRALRTLG